jgi:cytochrome c oxidase assembly factor CtaG
MTHNGHGHAPLAWTFDPLTVFLLALSTAAYALGLARIRRAGRGGILKPWRAAAFCAGTLMLFLGLLSPLTQLAASYFFAHMSRHLLLMLGAPPLLVASHPMIAWLCCFPPATRKRLSRWAARGAVRRAIGILPHLASVWTGAALALWFLHLPRPYAWALPSSHFTRISAAASACSFSIGAALPLWVTALSPSAYVSPVVV